MARSGRPLSADSITEEVKFLLKTLMRDDLFGEEVSLTEAEKLLESSLSIGFVEYCAFLKRHAYVDIDRARNTIAVLPRGKNVAEGGADPSLTPTLAAHFAKHIESPAAPVAKMNVIVARDELAKPSAPPAAPAKAGPASSPSVNAPPMSIALDAIAVERYPRREAIGQGSLGAVYRARDSVLERDVVVKEVRHVYELVTYLPRDEITRRVKEAVMAQARLDHPHILRVVDVNFVSDVPTIVLDRAQGGSLRERMTRGLLPVPVVMRLFLQLGYGLHHAHKNGVVHGGLKPENILFDAAGNARIADFGLARAAERLPDTTTSAPPVYIGRGNPSYMAPEQLHRGELTKSADIYALGILLYELLTGQLPGRRSPMPSSTPRVKEALGDKIARAVDDLFDRMTRDPVEERFASFDDVLSALYASLPEQDVVGRGTLLLHEEDPLATGPLSAEGEAVHEVTQVTSSSAAAVTSA
jgi:tRNA A-37 threonylcarbamoyl transferase component Bud32